MSRRIRVATMSLKHNTLVVREPKDIKDVLLMIDKLADEKIDILCLPEDFLGSVKCPLPISNLPIKALCKKAMDLHTYFIATFYVEEEGNVYNTSFVINREGKICGKYRKMHPTCAEINKYKVAPGKQFGVFELDFGKIGIMICFDIEFPEVCRILALYGAEIVFWPTQAYGFSEFDYELKAKARAIDNQIYLVSSNFAIEDPYLPGKVLRRSYIINPYGDMIACTGYHSGIAVANIDLDDKYRYYDPVSKEVVNWKAYIFQNRRPDLYDALLKEPCIK